MVNWVSVLLLYPLVVFAQTTDQSLFSTTQAADPTYTICNLAVVSTDSAGVVTTATAELPAETGLPTLPGVVCWDVFPTGGGVEISPALTIGSDGLPIPTAGPASSIPSSPGVTDFPQVTPSHGPSAPVIAGAVIGSVLGATILILGFIWFRKSRKEDASLDRSWIKRPGGWVREEKRLSDNIGRYPARSSWHMNSPLPCTLSTALKRRSDENSPHVVV